MTNKPIEGGNRKPSRLRFFLRLVLTVAVVSYCVFLNVQRCTVTAYADSDLEFSLTPAQTLAYYGTSFDAVYYNSENRHQLNITFDYVGTSYDFVPNDAPNRNIFYYSYLFGDTAGNALYPALASDRAFLRYRTNDLRFWDIESSSAVSDDFFISSGSSAINQYNLTLHPSFEITHIDTFEQMILVPVREDINRTEPSTFPYRNGQRYARTSKFNSGGNMVRNPNGNVPYFIIPHFRPGSYLEPMPDDSSHAAPYNSKLLFMASFSFNDLTPLIPDTYTDYTFTGLDVLWNWAGAYVEDAPLGTGLSVEIWIQCPKITGSQYVPPEVTTAPVTTTAPFTTRPPYTGEPYVTTPIFTYNLLPIESNQQVQIDIMNENLQYNAGTFDGINIIIKRLDDIYNAIKASGDLSVDQIAGLEWDTENLGNYVVNQLTSYTMASMNFNYVYRPFTSFMDIFDSYNWLDEFAILGGFSLAFGVFCWFVFRGRGGGA